VSGGSTEMLYGATGDRIKRTSAASTSYYPLGDDYEVSNGVTTVYISLPQLGLVAKKTESSFYWLHTDRLGSIQAISNGSGQTVQRSTYRPYGANIANQTGHVESRGYIGQRHDADTGISYLHARYFDPELALFVSPDPLHPVTPGVGLNGYGYALGDPVNGSDPSGLRRVCWEQSSTGADVGGVVGYNGYPGLAFPGAGVTQVCRNVPDQPAPPPQIGGTGYEAVPGSNPSAPQGSPGTGGRGPGGGAVPDDPEGGDDPQNDGAEHEESEDGTAVGQGKGERRKAAKPSGTDNEMKKYRPHPTNPDKVIWKDPHTGKDIVKDKPEGFDQWWTEKENARGRRHFEGVCESDPEICAAAAGFAAGYVIYRAFRMIPSLAPPLWWTIPANAVVP
jgi:RHS repeat-associated protein